MYVCMSVGVSVLAVGAKCRNFTSFIPTLPNFNIIV